MSVCLSHSDLFALEDLVEQVGKARQKDQKCTLETSLSVGTAKVYHMGKDNPVIRIDIKLKGEK
jgi:hypothetical protein